MEEANSESLPDVYQTLEDYTASISGSYMPSMDMLYDGSDTSSDKPISVFSSLLNGEMNLTPADQPLSDVTAEESEVEESEVVEIRDHSEGESPLPSGFLVDKTAVLEYWLCLEEKDRRSLVESDRLAVATKLRKQHAQLGCDCLNCKSRR